MYPTELSTHPQDETPPGAGGASPRLVQGAALRGGVGRIIALGPSGQRPQGLSGGCPWAPASPDPPASQVDKQAAEKLSWPANSLKQTSLLSPQVIFLGKKRFNSFPEK